MRTGYILMLSSVESWAVAVPKQNTALRGNTYRVLCHNFARAPLCASCGLSHLLSFPW